MPSPVGHSLIGLAIGALATLKPGSWRDLATQAVERRGVLAVAVLLANAPDVDYLPGLVMGDLNAYHHFTTHSLGWCALVALGCGFLAAALRRERPWRVVWWSLALGCSHLLADWLTADTRPPIGILMFWPFDVRFHLAPSTIFWALEKRDFSDMLQWHNVWAVLVEAAWCLPLVALAVGLKRRRRAAVPG